MEQDIPHGASGFIVWLTGYARASLIALAKRLESELATRGHGVVTLDSETAGSGRDRWRVGVHDDGGSAIAKLSIVASGLARQGAVVIVVATSPDREYHRQSGPVAGNVVEVYVPNETLHRHPVRAADMPAADEVLPSADLVVDGAPETVSENLTKVLAVLEVWGYLTVGRSAD